MEVWHKKYVKPIKNVELTANARCKEMKTQLHFIVLQLNTFNNVFMGRRLSFHQVKSHKFGQNLHLDF